ncbi:hypothetical protein NFI96_001124 [Prochilodus magdalenae]|nr:hypothetical protein NFI96_001124 [Prochilodus magdalenae]
MGEKLAGPWTDEERGGARKEKEKTIESRSDEAGVEGMWRREESNWRSSSHVAGSLTFSPRMPTTEGSVAASRLASGPSLSFLSLRSAPLSRIDHFSCPAPAPYRSASLRSRLVSQFPTAASPTSFSLSAHFIKGQQIISKDSSHINPAALLRFLLGLMGFDHLNTAAFDLLPGQQAVLLTSSQLLKLNTSEGRRENCRKMVKDRNCNEPAGQPDVLGRLPSQMGRLKAEFSQEATQLLVQSLVISRLDYCNSLLAGLPLRAIRPLQLVQNAAARLTFNHPKFTHVTPLLRSLHRLPVAARIRFKTLMFAYKAKIGPAPPYLMEMVKSRAVPRALRASSTARLEPPSLRTHERQASRLFSVLAPRWWNELPLGVRTAEFLAVFKRRLKTHLFVMHLRMSTGLGLPEPRHNARM